MRAVSARSPCLQTLITKSSATSSYSWPRHLSTSCYRKFNTFHFIGLAQAQAADWAESENHISWLGNIVLTSSRYNCCLSTQMVQQQSWTQWQSRQGETPLPHSPHTHIHTHIHTHTHTQRKRRRKRGKGPSRFKRFWPVLFVICDGHKTREAPGVISAMSVSWMFSETKLCRNQFWQWLEGGS